MSYDGLGFIVTRDEPADNRNLHNSTHNGSIRWLFFSPRLAGWV
jgi:hypothetical protein